MPALLCKTPVHQVGTRGGYIWYKGRSSHGELHVVPRIARISQPGTKCGLPIKEFAPETWPALSLCSTFVSSLSKWPLCLLKVLRGSALPAWVCPGCLTAWGKLTVKPELLYSPSLCPPPPANVLYGPTFSRTALTLGQKSWIGNPVSKSEYLVEIRTTRF